MTGHHELRVFSFAGHPLSRNTSRLPEGWKPFAAYPVHGALVVVARKWIREEGA